MGLKRGEISSEQLIALILVAFGFIIVIAFFTQLGIKDYSSDEVCKFSVISRATAEEVKSGAGAIAPLQCTTKKICIVAGRDGKCPQFAGEEFSYVYLPSFREGDSQSITQAANEIARIKTESMYSCWDSMGQGKLDLFNSIPDTYLPDPSKESTCVICSRIAIADDVPSYVVGNVSVQRYMRSNTIPGKTQTYLQVLMGDESTNTYTRFNENVLYEEAEKRQSLQGNLRNPNETAIIFMQFKPQDISEVLENQLQLGAGIVGGAFALAPTQSLSLAFRGGALYALGAAGLVAGAGATTAYIQQQTSIGYCGGLTTSEETNEGCSILQTVNYDVDDVKALCGSLQGNP